MIDNFKVMRRALFKELADSTFEQFETESFVQPVSSMIESSNDADAEMSPKKVLTALLGAGALGGTTSIVNAHQVPTSMHDGVVARGPGIVRTGPEHEMRIYDDERAVPGIRRKMALALIARAPPWAVGGARAQATDELLASLNDDDLLAYLG